MSCTAVMSITNFGASLISAAVILLTGCVKIDSTRLDSTVREEKESNTEVPAEPTVEIPAVVTSSVVGELRVHEGIGGVAIAPRRITVWLPPGYHAEVSRRYPVLYMQDGQNCFDAARSAFGMEWRMDEETTRLIEAGRIVPLLIVAIDNDGEKRRDEYGDTELGKAYRRFVIERVKPLIDANYRTNPDRKHTVAMGASLGGSASFLLAWERPDVFGGAACLSPAFFKPLQDRVRRHFGRAPDIRLYIDNGGVGIDQQLQPGISMMLFRLQMKGMLLNEDLVYFEDPKAEHNERAWSARVWRPLEFFFGVAGRKNKE